MSSAGPKRLTTIQKHEKVYYTYNETVRMYKFWCKQEGKPELFNQITQTFLYEKVAEEHDLSPKTVQRIVNRKIKEGRNMIAE